MKVLTQTVIVAALALVAIPLSAAFVPGTRPWLDRVGLLQPLTAIGVVSEAGTDEGAPRGPGQGPGGGRATEVLAAPVETLPLRDVITAIGSARGVQSVELSFEVAGRLKALTVAPGQKVEAGAVLAELDAEAAELAVERAELVLEDARRTVERLDQLAQSGTATALQRQEAELAQRTAELDLQAARRALADHRLLAPVAGHVGLIALQPGDLVSPATPVTRIEDRSSLIVEFRVPERAASLIGIDAEIEASAISVPGSAVAGRVVAVDNRVDEASRTLGVEALIPNAGDRLRAGMAFQVDLAFTGETYPAVDPLAIQWGAQGAFVWVLREGKANRLPIRIVQRNADAVLIEADFTPDDQVVTEGVQALRPGAEVTVTPARS